jgi:hypothetical protein
MLHESGLDFHAGVISVFDTRVFQSGIDEVSQSIHSLCGLFSLAAFVGFDNICKFFKGFGSLFLTVFKTFLHSFGTFRHANEIGVVARIFCNLLNAFYKVDDFGVVVAFFLLNERECFRINLDKLRY